MEIDERRVASGIELRIEPGTRPRLVGYAAVFNSRSVNLGGFVEVIQAGAFRRSLQGGADIRAFVDHDSRLIIGRRTAKTLTLEEDSHGLRVDISPPDTQAGRDVIENVRVGNLDGMSFAFRTPKGGDAWDLDADPPVRTLLDIDFSEVSVVAMPAYPATDVALRSLQAAQEAKPAAPDPSRSRPSLAILEARQRQARG